ncbi:MAG: class I SAM-dependent DNA methyltransferase, partial [bacterium]|nr:class I SAM-dependent DNA methyltransferase [bacterium]
MDKPFAIKIIRDTFEQPFDKGKYVYFIKNLLNQIDESTFSYHGAYIPDAYKPYIKKYERIGKYTDTSGNKLDILIVNLIRETSLERARTMQRNFVAHYLKNRDGKDAALVAFHTDELEDWRFSLVKMEYRLAQTEKGDTKGEKEFNPARRYSFLVGKNEPNHTAQQQLVPLLIEDHHNPTLTQLESAFNIESVTKEFFTKYRLLFLDLKEYLDELCEKDKIVREEFIEKNVDTVNFAKKLLGQIVFLYFLQKKGWLGVPPAQNWGRGDRSFLRTLFNQCSGKNFFNDCLEYLFYDALNNPNRGGIDQTYYPRFKTKIPFLNGGLFDPIQNYNWEKTDIILPNDIFSNNERTKEGDTGSGILDIFDRYNFTVKEDEPLDREVAIDPEMLGKVFENLLEVKDRKSKGTYYTPREIV